MNNTFYVLSALSSSVSIFLRILFIRLVDCIDSNAFELFHGNDPCTKYRRKIMTLANETSEISSLRHKIYSCLRLKCLC